MIFLISAWTLFTNLILKGNIYLEKFPFYLKVLEMLTVQNAFSFNFLFNINNNYQYLFKNSAKYGS